MSTDWRPLPGYETTYLVSDAGEVMSLPRNTTRGGLLKSSIGKRGYPTVHLTQRGHSVRRAVHLLVAATFLGPRPEGHDVRHLDGDRTNPRASNLAYGTRSENVRDCLEHGTHHQANKTHCPQGHPYDEENTRVTPARPNARYCRACRAARTVGRQKNHPEFRAEEWA